MKLFYKMNSLNTPLNPTDSVDGQLSQINNQRKDNVEENQRFTKHSALATLF